MSFANSEIVSPLASWFKPLKGMEPYNKKNVTDAQAQTNKVMKVLDEHLLINTYLVGERLTLADVFTAFMVVRGFSNFFDKEWREQHPNVTRWFQTVSQQPIFTDVGFAVSFCDKAIPNQAPPKAEAPKEKKEAAKPKAAAKPAADDDDEDDAPPAPKPKHPLEALPKPTFVLDDLKREYSNKETREEALPWFWEHANFEEYSLWQVDYKYNNELTMTFMTSNLVGKSACNYHSITPANHKSGGFFTRLEASRKYLFGTGNVFGTTNDSIVRGAFLVRGQDAVPAFDVAPDADSYTFTKLDPKAAGIKEFVNDMWAQDKPITVDGKSYEWADGKVFK